MPEIIETRSISLDLGAIQVTGFLFLADPEEDSFIEGRVDVLGVFQVEIVARVGEPLTVEITIPEGLVTVTFTFDVPTRSFLCQAQPKNAYAEAEWHVLAPLHPDGCNW